MEKQQIVSAMNVARSFIERGEVVLSEKDHAPKSSGNLRRASLELTRALADMRKSSYVLNEEKRIQREAVTAMLHNMRKFDQGAK